MYGKYIILSAEKEHGIAKRCKIRYTPTCIFIVCGEFETILT